MFIFSMARTLGRKRLMEMDTVWYQILATNRVYKIGDELGASRNMPDTDRFSARRDPVNAVSERKDPIFRDGFFQEPETLRE